MLRAKHRALAPALTERSRRLWAATEARALGRGGIALVERATGISRSTIQRGLQELEADAPLPVGRTRQVGGGRKRTTAVDRTLLRDLEALVEPTAPGDPRSPLRWSSKSVRTLAFALQALGHQVSHTVVAEPRLHPRQVRSALSRTRIRFFKGISQRVETTFSGIAA